MATIRLDYAYALAHSPKTPLSSTRVFLETQRLYTMEDVEIMLCYSHDGWDAWMMVDTLLNGTSEFLSGNPASPEVVLELCILTLDLLGEAISAGFRGHADIYYWPPRWDRFLSEYELCEETGTSIDFLRPSLSLDRRWCLFERLFREQPYEEEREAILLDFLDVLFNLRIDPARVLSVLDRFNSMTERELPLGTWNELSLRVPLDAILLTLDTYPWKLDMLVVRFPHMRALVERLEMLKPLDVPLCVHITNRCRDVYGPDLAFNQGHSVACLPFQGFGDWVWRSCLCYPQGGKVFWYLSAAGVIQRVWRRHRERLRRKRFAAVWLMPSSRLTLLVPDVQLMVYRYVRPSSAHRGLPRKYW